MVRGLRIACRNISVSLKDTGPLMAGSTERDALRRSSTPREYRGSRHVRLRREPLNGKKARQYKAFFEIFSAARADRCSPRRLSPRRVP